MAQSLYSTIKTMDLFGKGDAAYYFLRSYSCL